MDLQKHASHKAHKHIAASFVAPEVSGTRDITEGFSATT
jgi:hypothetical protein